MDVCNSLLLTLYARAVCRISAFCSGQVPRETVTVTVVTRVCTTNLGQALVHAVCTVYL